MPLRKYMLAVILLLGICIPYFSNAAELLEDKTIIEKAVVVSIEKEDIEIFPGTEKPIDVQTITAQIKSGEESGKIVQIINDYVMLDVGDTFYMSRTIPVEGAERYAVFEPNRLPVLIFFAVVFIILVVIFGGIQGLRGLLSLSGSLLVIIFVLLPGIFQGFSPLLLSVGVSALIVIFGSYITHGFNKTTSSAVLGMIGTVVITGLMAHIAVNRGHLTGLADDSTFYLNFNMANLDIMGLLMGGIMIGLLGILYDVAIGQAISVEELYRVAPHLPKRTIYKRAIRIGREHIGALVNTLAIAYVGASLPLMLLFYSAPDISIGMILNREVFSTEIIRILIGSIGLVLAVPITTLLSVRMLIPRDTVKNASPQTIKKEREALEHFEHSH